MAIHDIETNPEALRAIASNVSSYTNIQYDIIRTYLRDMSSEAVDIQVNGYNMLLEAIGEWVKRMDQLKDEGAQFAAFLNAKADALDEFSKK